MFLNSELYYLTLLLILNTFHDSFSLLTSIKARVVLIRDLYEYDSSQNLNETNNSKFIIRNSLKKSVIEEIVNEIPNSDTILKLSDLTHDRQRGYVTLRFDCVAAYPISWVYEGLEFPKSRVYTESRRSFESFSDPTTYRYFATVYLRKIEEFSGKFACRSLQDPQIEIFYFVFIPGPKFFVPDSGLNIGVTQNEENVVIPCAVTHPTEVTSALFKVDEMGHPERVNLTTFDPKVGFILLYKDHFTPWGQYVCTAGNNSMTNSLIVNVDPPKKFIVRPTIQSNFVHLTSHIKQMFICEAKENVTIKFSAFKVPQKISYEFDPTKDFPFIASYKSDPKIFPDFSFITCLTQPNSSDGSRFDEKVLHTWEYSIYGNDRNLTLSYEPKLDAFLCCTVDSSMKPVMTSFYPCGSAQECQLRHFQSSLKKYKIKNWGRSSSSGWRHSKKSKKKKSCTNKMEDFFMEKSEEAIKMMRIWNHYMEPGSRVHENVPLGCTGLKRAHEDHQGYFRCSIENDNRFHTKDFYYYSPLKSRPVFRMEDIAESDLISIKLNPNEGIRVGQAVQVVCKVNGLFFSRGQVWAFERIDGEIRIVPEHLMGEDVIQKDDGDSTMTKRIGTIKFVDKDIIRLYCFAPFWNSTEWKNSSIPIELI